MHDPADYARNHWRKYESQEEHAERVAAAEQLAGRYFASATQPQLAVYNETMAFLRGFSGPVWDRRRKFAQAFWHESTARERAMFEITADEIMRDGEVSEATSLAWDVLAEATRIAPAPSLIPVTIPAHPEAQASL